MPSSKYANSSCNKYQVTQRCPWYMRILLLEAAELRSELCNGLQRKRFRRPMNETTVYPLEPARCNGRELTRPKLLQQLAELGGQLPLLPERIVLVNVSHVPSANKEWREDGRVAHALKCRIHEAGVAKIVQPSHSAVHWFANGVLDARLLLHHQLQSTHQ